MGISSHMSEDDVRDKIGAYLRHLGVKYNMNQTMNDIRCADSHIIIETKTVDNLDFGPHHEGKGSRRDESPYDQVKRYVLEARKNDRRDDNVEWLGIVTDGERWWIWRWPKDYAVREHKDVLWDGRRLTESSELELSHILRRSVGKIGLPDDPETIFNEVIDDLNEHYRGVGHLSETAVQEKLWDAQLLAGGNKPKPDHRVQMFVIHSLLIMVSRILSDNESKDGFAGWAASNERIHRKLADTINAYNWTDGKVDVLRDVYLALVKRVTKKQLRRYGEYYTPNWLADFVCGRVIDDGFVKKQLDKYVDGRVDELDRVLDPACGSGTFLYHAARRLLNNKHVKENLLAIDRADFVNSMICGIDIHPVAVEMSIANLRLLLGSDVTPNVYQGDAMMAEDAVPTFESLQDKVLFKTSTILSAEDQSVDPVPSTKGKIVRKTREKQRSRKDRITDLVLPMKFLKQPDKITRFVDTAKQRKPLPSDVRDCVDPKDRPHLAAQHAVMAEIIRNEGNGVWSWFLRNQAAPMLLAEDGPKVGRIVANPPWVNNRNMPDKERMERIKQIALNLGVWNRGGNEAATFDLAVAFVPRCESRYLKKGGRAGWVLPQAAMTGQRSWIKLRERYGDATMIDFGGLPFPENAPCSVIMTGLKPSKRTAVKKDGVQIDPSTVWEDAEGKISFVPYAEPASSRASGWVEGGGRVLVRMGPTLLPTCLVQADDFIERGGGYGVETARSRHPPWKEVRPIRGEIPKAWLHEVLTGYQVLPFCALKPARFILPLRRITHADKTETDLSWDWDGADDNMFWKNCRNAYARHRSKNAPRMLDDRCLYNGDLDAQLKYGGPAVVYNKSGSNVSAVPLRRLPITNVTLYWVRCRTFDEAKYLSSILNADAMHGAIMSTKKGSLDIASEPFREIPMRRFDPKNEAHAKLARLAVECESVGRKAAGRAVGGLNAQRGAVRDALRKSGHMGRIDGLCAEILPDYAKQSNAA